ncbi:hypothetical protein BDZ89DRAFT_448214 [Hymenopellis radicata]|nr:hypothetical protein BDZ89DRAFT_448214 [Hymenopellis radicata]
MMQPYYLHGLTSGRRPILGIPYGWSPATHTEYIALFSESTDSEKVLLSAIRETTREIFRMVTAQGVLTGFEEENGIPAIVSSTARFCSIRCHCGCTQSKMTSTPGSITQLIKEWKKFKNELMAWLDWSVWIKCRPWNLFSAYMAHVRIDNRDAAQISGRPAYPTP